MADAEHITGAWRALGRQLAASRAAAGLSQEQLAPLASYSRSTVANVETGRQHVPRTFWHRCDQALGTGDALASGYDEVEAAARRERERAADLAQRARTAMTGRVTETAAPAGFPPCPDEAAQREPVVVALRAGDLTGPSASESSGGGISAGRRALAGAGLDPAATTELIRRLRVSDVDAATLEALAATTETLCTQYAYRRPGELRREAQHWLVYVSDLLARRVGLREHRELLVTAGWLTLLIGCLEYDSGLSAAAEATRVSALHLGREAGHSEIIAWSLEMAAWFAHTRHDLAGTIAYARAGQDVARGASVAIQLVAHEARALGRMGDKRAVGAALERGHNLLQRMPAAGNPRNHFVVDPAKFDFYAMDCYRVAGDDQRAAGHAAEVLRTGRGLGGQDLAPMRMAEARIALAAVSARAGDLDQAVHYGAQAFGADRKCLPSLLLVAGELDTEIRQRYPGEQAAREFHEQLTDLRQSAAAHPQR